MSEVRSEPLGNDDLELDRLHCQVDRHVRFHPSKWQGTAAVVLENTLTGEQVRCDVETADWLRQLSTDRPLNTFAGASSRRYSLIRLLLARGFLVSNVALKQSRPAALTQVTKFLAYRVRFGNPDRWFTAISSATSAVHMRTLLFVTVVLAGFAAITTANQPGSLVAHYEQRFFDPLSLLLMLLVFPAVKLVHETAHGVAMKRLGARSRDWGVVFFALMPVPYVEASEATLLPEKKDRTLVSAAGLWAEVLLGLAAVLVFFSLEVTTTWRDVAFNVAFVCCVSSVLFNANPFLKFDGYYILADWLERPNLLERSLARVRGVAIQALAGKTAATPGPGGGDKTEDHALLLLFGTLTVICRTLLVIVIAGWLAMNFWLAGSVLALLLLATRVFYPVATFARDCVLAARASDNLLRATTASTATLTLLLAMLLVPINHTLSVDGMLQVHPDGIVRTETPGFVAEIIVADGAAVSAGDPLLRLANEALLAERTNAQLAIAQQEVARQVARMNDRQSLDSIESRIRLLDARLARLNERAEDLLVRAPVSGTFNLADAEKILGRYLPRGEYVGAVTSLSRPVVLSVVPESDLRDIAMGTSASVLIFRPDAMLGKAVDAHVIAVRPLLSRELPDARYGSRKGGSVRSDMASGETDRALEPVALVELALPEIDRDYRPGKVRVSINAGAGNAIGWMGGILDQWILRWQSTLSTSRLIRIADSGRE